VNEEAEHIADKAAPLGFNDLFWAGCRPEDMNDKIEAAVGDFRLWGSGNEDSVSVYGKGCKVERSDGFIGEYMGGFQICSTMDNKWRLRRLLVVGACKSV